MIYRNVGIPLFSIIEEKVLCNLSDIIKKQNLYFDNTTILVGNYGKSILDKYKIKKHFKNVKVINIKKTPSISYIRSEVVSSKSELIISIGGGYINDLSKYISMETSIPLISIPTILSNDGIASPISILKRNDKYKSFGTTPPIGVIADIDIIKTSPKKYILSGIGDLISNISANLDWELANKETGEKIDLYAKNIAFNSAIKVLFNFTQNKYISYRDKNLIVDLFEGLIMSALSMIISGSSRPASGSEHNISHALDKLGSKELHGIQVGFATLYTLELHKEYKILKIIKDFYKFLGFPTDFKNLRFNRNLFNEALKIAPSIRDRFTILNLRSDY